MFKLIISTKNNDKYCEIKALLKPLNIECLSLNDMDFKGDIEEVGETFFENAYIKAKTIAELYNIPALGDDSGLVVKALPNELGVKSKRFSNDATTESNNELLLKKLENEINRDAYFVSQIVLYFPKGKFYTYQGRVNGEIAKDYKGNNGFGYDPIFIISGLGKRMAEITKEEKNQISHRGRAMAKLVEDLKNETISIQ